MGKTSSPSFVSSLYPRPLSTSYNRSWNTQKPKCFVTAKVTNTTSTDRLLSGVIAAAASRGYQLRNCGTWPILNLRMYVNSEDTTDNSVNEQFIGGINGVLLPNNRLHIESYKAGRIKETERKALLTITPGIILFIGALAYAQQNGVKHVYGLAINDAPQQHKRLVRYLKRFGGIEVKRVTDSLADVPARMFYGGFGTIIRGDVESMFARGKNMLERTDPK